jgi:hypothetical protein
MQNSTIETYTLSKLQMFDECQQKYKLCYIDKVHIIENPNKYKSSKKGNNIHNIINYFLKGMDVTKLVTALDKDEKILWNNFKNCNFMNFIIKASEYSFNIKFDNYWLNGRIDALFQNNDKYVILDWKTGQNFDANNAKFQTKFYLLCIYEILKTKQLINKTENLSLIYLNLATNSKIELNFDDNLYQNYKSEILSIINKINTNSVYFCNKTDNCSKCKYYSVCPYI